jgi:hypothetical protein
MLTLQRRRQRRVPPQRGRGAILGLFSCCAQCSISAVVVSSNRVVSLSAFPKSLSSHSEACKSQSILLIVPLAASILGFACTNRIPQPMGAMAFGMKHSFCPLREDHRVQFGSGGGVGDPLTDYNLGVATLIQTTLTEECQFPMGLEPRAGRSQEEIRSNRSRDSRNRSSPTELTRNPRIRAGFESDPCRGRTRR